MRSEFLFLRKVCDIVIAIEIGYLKLTTNLSTTGFTRFPDLEPRLGLESRTNFL